MQDAAKSPETLIESLMMSTSLELEFADEERRQHLGRLIRERRGALDMSQQDVLVAGGPSPTTMRALEHGRVDKLSLRSVHRLEHALGWQRNSIENFIVDGEIPEISVEGIAKEAENAKIRDLEVLVHELSTRLANLQQSVDSITSLFRKL